DGGAGRQGGGGGPRAHPEGGRAGARGSAAGGDLAGGARRAGPPARTGRGAARRAGEPRRRLLDPQPDRRPRAHPDRGAGRAGGPRNAALHAGGSGPPLREDLRARAEHRQGGAGPGGARLRRRLPRPNVSRAGQPRRAGGRVHAQERRDARGAREARVRGGGLARREPGRHPEARHAGRRGDPLAARRPVAVTAGHPAPASPADPHAPESPPIQVDGLWRSYRRGRVRAVRGVSFAVPRGEVFGLIGPDGAGKTSVLQVLAGVLRADAGTVRVAGVDVSRDPEAVKEAIGYMPQGLGLNLYDSLTVEENIEFFRDLRRVPAPQYRDNRERL